MAEESRSVRVGLVVAVVAVFIAGVIVVSVGVQRDRLDGRPNSVSTCDTPPALR